MSDIQELQQALASVHQRGRGVERVMGPEDGRLEKETTGYEQAITQLCNDAID